MVFSSTIDKVDWNTRRVTCDTVAEITRLKAEDGGPMRIGGATLAGAAIRAGLIDEYSLATYPVMVGEDAHWIDEVSESMLADFLTVIPQTPSLVLATYRPEYEGALARVHGSHHRPCSA